MLKNSSVRSEKYCKFIYLVRAGLFIQPEEYSGLSSVAPANGQKRSFRKTSLLTVPRKCQERSVVLFVKYVSGSKEALTEIAMQTAFDFRENIYLHILFVAAGFYPCGQTQTRHTLYLKFKNRIAATVRVLSEKTLAGLPPLYTQCVSLFHASPYPYWDP